MSQDRWDMGSLLGNGHAQVGELGVIRALASDLTSRIDLARIAGLTFGGRRDLYEALGYPRVLMPRDYRDRYARGDVAARIVEAFPKATWSGGAEIIEDEDPEVSTPLEEDFAALVKRLSIFTILSRADVLAGLGHFAVVLVGAKGKLDMPLPSMRSQEDVLYLTAYGPDEVVVDVYDQNQESERFGLPLLYHVQRRVAATRTSATMAFDARIHWTRVVHVADGLLDDRVNGTPRLEKVWNRLDDLDKVVGGGSEAFWRRAHQGYHWNIDPDVKIGADEIKKLKEEAEEFEHGLRRTMATRGMELTAMGSDVANFANPVTALISLISGATGIPQRILLGSERGELASTQDKENWNERVEARRLDYGTPIVRDLVDRLVKAGALPEPADDYDVRWPEIATLTQTEQAGVADVWAGLSAKAGGPVVTPEEIRDRVLRLDPMAQDQKDEAQAELDQKKADEQAKLDAIAGRKPDEAQPQKPGQKPPQEPPA